MKHHFLSMLRGKKTLLGVESNKNVFTLEFWGVVLSEYHIYPHVLADFLCILLFLAFGDFLIIFTMHLYFYAF